MEFRCRLILISPYSAFLNLKLFYSIFSTHIQYIQYIVRVSSKFVCRFTPRSHQHVKNPLPEFQA